MATVSGIKGFTQLGKLNCLDDLRIKGVPVSTGGAAARANYQLVKSPSDFPAPVGGVITLANNFDYEINGVIDITPNLINGTGSNIIYGQNPQLDKIITSNVGAMVNTVDEDLGLRSLTLTNLTGTIVDAADTGGGAGLLTMRSCVITDSVGVGTVDSIPIVTFSNNIITNTPNGLNFAGSGIILNLNNNTFNTSASGNIIDLGNALFDAVNINSNYLRATTVTNFIIALADSGNVDPTGQGSILNNVTIGTAPTVSGVTPGDLRWDLIANNTLPDSIDVGSIYMIDNPIETVINSISADTFVEGGTVDNSQTKRFEMGGANQLFYRGRKTIQATVIYTITARRSSSSGNRLYTFVVYKNGGAITGAFQTYELDNRERNITVATSVQLNLDDKLELWVRNDENTANILVTNFTCVTASS